jgi:hypothetical protein
VSRKTPKSTQVQAVENQNYPETYTAKKAMALRTDGRHELACWHLINVCMASKRPSAVKMLMDVMDIGKKSLADLTSIFQLYERHNPEVCWWNNGLRIECLVPAAKRHDRFGEVLSLILCARRAAGSTAAPDRSCSSAEIT